jgi:hypothetical protein
LIHGLGLAGLVVIFFFNWRAGQNTAVEKGIPETA